MNIGVSGVGRWCFDGAGGGFWEIFTKKGAANYFIRREAVDAKFALVIFDVTREVWVVAVEQVWDDFEKKCCCRGIKVDGFNLTTLIICLIA